MSAPSNLNCGNSEPDISLDCGRNDPRLQEPAITYKQILALKPGRHWVSQSLYVFVSDEAAIVRVMRFARAQGHEVANVAEIRENARQLLPRVNGTKRHFAALNYAEIPAFVRELRAQQDEALSPAVSEFILLTASRENESVGMKWGEVDWLERVWTVPAERMKAGRAHRVPLCDRAMMLLSRQRGPTLALEPADPNA